MLDIKRDDLLVIGSAEYPIKAVAIYPHERIAPGLLKQTTVSCSTKRYPQVSGGKRGAAATNLSSLKCTSMLPVDAETAQRQNLQTPYQLRQVFIQDSTSFAHIFIEYQER